MSKIFERKLNELGVELTDNMKRQFDIYYEMLTEWNKVMNLSLIHI